MSGNGRSDRHDYHHVAAGKAPEPFFLKALPRFPRGLALDIASGNGRHALAMALAGIRVVALDKSIDAVRELMNAARSKHLPIWPVVGDVDIFPLGTGRFDAIVNVNFLNRALFPKFIEALKPGGVLLADTFLVDQATIGRPRSPEHLLKHGELRELMRGLEVEVSREGLVEYPDGMRAWRAGALGRKLG
jgi:SAM-dependent methyltransferase